MFDILRPRVALPLFAAALIMLPAFAQPVEGQAAGRMRVLVADLTPTEGASDRFGRQIAEELRDRIDIATHVALSDDDIDDAADEFGLDWREIGCLQGMQLAIEMNAGMLLCGRYTQTGDNVEYTAQFMTVPNQETFAVDPQTVAANDAELAADNVMAFFEETIETVSQIAFCGRNFNSSIWDAALEDCSRAVELAPESVEARMALARTHMELEQYEESLDQFQTILEIDPFNVIALETAGYVATQLGETDQARDYYSRYLELNPSNVAIRIRVARELAEGGDDLGGMQLLEAGLADDPENVELHEQYGSMAARAALQIQSQQPQPAAGETRQVTPEAADLFRKAVESLTMVLEARGQESLPQYVQSVMAAHIQLGEMEEAIELGQRGTQYFPDNADVRSVLANAYNQAGQLDQAIATLEEALELDPDLPNAYARIGQWLLDAERVDEAAEAFAQAAERGEQPVDTLGMMIFGFGYQTKDQAENDIPGAIEAYNAARTLDISPALEAQINFFHAYGLYRMAEARQAENTVESARATLPMFQQALTLFNQARPYGDANPGSNLDQFIAGATTFIEIQEAMIARAERGG